MTGISTGLALTLPDDLGEQGLLNCFRDPSFYLDRN